MNRPVFVLSRLKSMSLTYKHEIIRQSHEVSSRSECNPPHAGAKMGTITVTIFAFFSEIQLLNKQKVVE